MPPTRVFLGWDRPCLPQAAAYLRRRFTQAETCDLSAVRIVVPVARAGRRLLELLTSPPSSAPAAPPPPMLIPPRLLTPGELPEELYLPDQPVVSELEALLARVYALRHTPAEVLATIVTHPPAPDDFPAWLALALELEHLDDELAAEDLTFADALQKLQTTGDLFLEEPRWQALIRIQQGYEAVLQTAGKTDRNRARRRALEQGNLPCADPIILLGTTDLPRLIRRFLAAVAAPLTALIHAPESEAAAFDELGCLNVPHWLNRPVPLDLQQLRVVPRPQDQAFAVRDVLGEQTAAHPRTHSSSPATASLPSGKKLEKETTTAPAPDDYTIGLGDPTLAPIIERVLALAGVPTRQAVGRPLPQTRPMLALAALAHWLSTQRFDALAALVRHPDVESFLQARRLTVQTPDGVSWLTLLDEYLTDHLQSRCTGVWLGDASTAAALAAVHDALRALAPPDHAQPRPLPAWSEPLANVLAQLYAEHQLRRTDAHDAELIHALTTFTRALQTQAELDPANPLTPRMDFAQAVSFTLTRLATAAAPAPAGPPAVELLGWLELPLDDAPHLIVTGFNEGAIPQSVSADAFLPDGTRRRLGLLDNERRLARDKAALTVLYHSRRTLTLIAGRHGADDQPLAPSRLLLACAVEDIPARLRTFLAPTSLPTPLLLTPGEDRFFVPPVRPLETEIDQLPVTAFRVYLACPYRFYLQYVLKLRSVDDVAVEMDALQFGSLAHEVLDDFGHSDLASSVDGRAIADFLNQRLRARAARRFGDQPTAPVLIQIELLRQRLHAFAHRQAQWTAEGWRILRDRVEKELTAVLTVDNKPFHITGRIDRIDHHPATNAYRILDYKTGDTAPTPDQTHRSHNQWVDLQLPLYRELARSVGIDGEIALGYIVLPKKLEEVGLRQAEWSAAELDEALAQACKVARCIRAGVFWPPKYPVDHFEEFRGLCMDDSPALNHALSLGHEIERQRRARS